MELELNAGTILDPKVRLKIIEYKRELPRPNNGDIEKIDEKIIVCYQRVIRSESEFHFNLLNINSLTEKLKELRNGDSKFEELQKVDLSYL